MFDEIHQLEGGQSLRLDLHNWRLERALPVRRWYHILELRQARYR